MAIPLGHKFNDEIVNVGVDTVTGEVATTGGPYASGNPVVPMSHPAATAAMKKHKTGPYADKPEQESEEPEKEPKEPVKTTEPAPVDPGKPVTTPTPATTEPVPVTPIPVTPVVPSSQS